MHRQAEHTTRHFSKLRSLNVECHIGASASQAINGADACNINMTKHLPDSTSGDNRHHMLLLYGPEQLHTLLVQDTHCQERCSHRYEQQHRSIGVPLLIKLKRQLQELHSNSSGCQFCAADICVCRSDVKFSVDCAQDQSCMVKHI